MEENIGVLFATSEQHRTATLSRVNRDKSDIDMIYQRLKDFSPFKDNPTLLMVLLLQTPSMLTSLVK